jgi:predicted polyphosphate/ATP-dependent NAD kinase
LTTVGIIANPVSGKDIRRLVAHGSVFDNQEKVRMVRRLLTGLDQTGVRRVVYMPDHYAIVNRAVSGCKTDIETAALPMRMENSHADSTLAAQWMDADGAACVIVLGGDGTCRAVAKGTRRLPLMPISTGTNNVFPRMLEATIAGLAAGLIAEGRVPVDRCTFRSCCLEILMEGVVADVALVDVAVCHDYFIASRAIWDLQKVSQLFLSRCRPDNIGLSAIGGQIRTVEPDRAAGLHLCLGSGGRKITAAVAPGLFRTVRVQSEKMMAVGETFPLPASACVLALDGEREIELPGEGRRSVRLSDAGPIVVDVEKTMKWAQRTGAFVTQEKRIRSRGG